MTTVFGIRHHGPGCARSLPMSLDDLAPDLILLEMPAEAEPLLPYAAHADIKPPVAILFHSVEHPDKAIFYPFAEFSPEWNAIHWALSRGVPIRCFDLPAAHSLALKDEDSTPPESRPDAFEWLARADGYSDGERWWNDRIEERRDHRGLFQAILEAVSALRTELAFAESQETLMREAWMRKCLRTAEKEGFGNIAVVCGAWHAPALIPAKKASADQNLLKGLPKLKLAATWIPWTMERLTYASGYGAGIRSPGWYQHLWDHPVDPIPRWMTRAARILRGAGQDASSAAVIESLRLANSLSGLRGRPLPGLDETLEAMKSVFCQGDDLPLDLLRKDLLIGDKLGEVPASIQTLPLQQDIDATARRLRLKPLASVTPVELDLREEGGRARSIFLHRLLALKIPWGKKENTRGHGTFKERWSLKWNPDFAVAIIDASAHGNTVESAANRRIVTTLPLHADAAAIAELLDLALLASLSEAVIALLRALDAKAATAADVADLLAAMPALARICRYGDVRETNAGAVTKLLAGFATRIHAALPISTSGIDDDAAEQLFGLLTKYSSALTLVDDAELVDQFRQILAKMSDMQNIHPLLRGMAVRLRRDALQMADEEVGRLLAFALSPGMSAKDSAAWLKGFLHRGGSLLVHDPMLLNLVDRWLCSLSAEIFQATLPLLRRTFGSFESPERSRIGAAVASPRASGQEQRGKADLDWNRAMPATTSVASLLKLIEMP